MRWLERWRLLAVLNAAILLLSFAIGAPRGFDEGAARMIIRFTARTSLLFFLLAFTASAMGSLWPSRPTRWQRRNRRYLGLAFAFSHAVHAVAIITLVRMGPAQAAEALTTDMLIFGGVGYALIAAMAATSFDRTAAMLGPRAWRWLHLIGAHYLWIQFIVAFGKRIPVMPGYAIFIALLAGAMILRIVAARRSRRRAAYGAAPTMLMRQ